jgi:hypothetical protein
MGLVEGPKDCGRLTRGEIESIRNVESIFEKGEEGIKAES